MNLTPPLRGEITYLRFSPDGKYILAQDDSGINLLTREPFAIVFRIEAPEAKPAMFTPDSQRVVFYNSNLRVESWNVADGIKADAHEVILPQRLCLQTELSSDGKILACYDSHYSLSLYDVATSQQLFEKKDFYTPQSLFEWLGLVLALRQGNDINLLNMQFSPDNHYFLAARSDRNRVIMRFDAVSSGNEKVALAVDLLTRKPVSLGGSLKEVMSGGFAFHSSTEIIGEYYMDSDRSGIYSFPDGKKIEQFKMLGDSFTMANQGDYVIVRPISEYPAAIYDVKAKKIIVGNKQSAIDVYGGVFVAERRNGELGLYDLSNLKAMALITLPRNSLGALRVAEVSPDLKWLAVSERSRGAVWELSTGRRVFHIRGFRGAYFADDGQIYADFPKYDKTERTVARMMPMQQDIAEGIQLPEAYIEQYGPYLIQTTPASEQKGKAQKEKKDQEQAQAAKKGGDEQNDKAEKSSQSILGIIFGGGAGDSLKNVRLEARDAQQGNTLWARDFTDEAPARWGDSQHGTLTLGWKLSSRAASNIIKADAALSQRASGMGDKEGDYLLQVLELKTGKVLGQLLIETGKGSFVINNIMTAGDWVVVSDSENRVLVYSLSSGQLKQRFFGSRAAVNAKDNLLCVENERGQLIVYNLETGTKLDEFSFSSPVSLIQFVSDGKQLFVLTANQTTYLLKIA